MIELGSTASTIARTIWWTSGFTFGIYTWSITNKKIDGGLLLLCIMGPVGWLFWLFLNIFKSIVTEQTKELYKTLSFILAILITLIPLLLMQLK